MLGLPRELDEAAQAAGAGIAAVARQIHWPLLQPAIGAAALIMFIECVKELPATLLLRPLNTETLATFLYGEASRGVYEDGAIAALAMVALGLLPLIIFILQTDQAFDQTLMPVCYPIDTQLDIEVLSS